MKYLFPTKNNFPLEKPSFATIGNEILITNAFGENILLVQQFGKTTIYIEADGTTKIIKVFKKKSNKN